MIDYQQVDIKTGIYTNSPTVLHKFFIPNLPQLFDSFNHVYKLLKNLYGFKDTNNIRKDFFKKGLIQHGWVQSTIYGCLFTKSGMLLILYVADDCFIS